MSSSDNMPFATVAGYRAMYDSPLSDERVWALLGKASRMIARACADAGVNTDDPGDEFAAALEDVCIDAAHRADPAASGCSEVPFGATQFSIGADGFSQSFSMGNPYGNLFLTKAERELLGIADSGEVGSLWPMTPEDRG